MSRLKDDATLHERTVQRAAELAAAQTVKRQRGGPRVRNLSGEVTSTRPHPLAWAFALEQVDGDTSRLRAQPDGSVRID